MTRNIEIKETLLVAEQITIHYGVLNDTLNFRRTAGMGENIITQISRNIRVEVLELERHNTYWYKIKFNEQISFIYCDGNNLTVTTHTQFVTPGLYVGETYQGNMDLQSSINWIRRNARSGSNYTIILGKDETINNIDLSYNNIRVNITLKTTGVERNVRYSITQPSRSLITIGKGVTFTLEEGINIIGLQRESLRLVRVNGGTFIMNGGSIRNSIDGGGVIIEDDGTFIMNNGTISGNSRRDSNAGSGGVQINKGTFTMNGGTINGNSTINQGGGVALNSGTFTMNAGTVSGNTANSNGGGIYIYDGTFVMHNGTISGNTSRTPAGTDVGGGGVYMRQGTFTMNNGTINNNTATADGGGVFISSGTFNMNNGVINGNRSTNCCGGGVWVGSGTFNMNNGTISGNSALMGGGVAGSTNATFIKSNRAGIIYGSNASEALANRASDNTRGHAIGFGSSNSNVSMRRNTTAGTTQAISTRQRGAAGGWQ